MSQVALPLSAAPYELRELRAALLRLARDEPAAFAALFDPLGRRCAVRLASPELSFILRQYGLVSGADALVGCHRIRRCADRLYVMELGGVSEYFQDIWPETDALLAALAESPRGSLLDMGTGTGIVAIEAAARGHRVVATDLYETALTLARFNAALNGLGQAIEFRRGHLLDPVAGERFDLILTAPHYTRVADQLRLEVLRTVAGHIAPGGRAVLATVLEWQADGPLAAVETILRPQVEQGLRVTILPLLAQVKRQWFTVARTATADGDAEDPALVSKHRFLVIIKPGQPELPGQLALTRPAEMDVVMQDYVPLSRLRLGQGPAAAGRPMATVTTAADVARLGELLDSLSQGVVTLSGTLPGALLDVCRYGRMPCVTAKVVDGAAGAILDAGGGVRPCTHGQPVAGVADSMDQVMAILSDESARAAVRRGCAHCSARAGCSRCLFPYPLDEPTYCALIRQGHGRWPLLYRLLDVLSLLGTAAGPLQIKTRSADTLVAARGRPAPDAIPEGRPADRRLHALATRWRRQHTWITVDSSGQHGLFFQRAERLHGQRVTPLVAAIGELIADGVTAAGLCAYLQATAQPVSAGDAGIASLWELLS